MKRGRYFTIPQAVEAYPGVLTERLIRRLVAEKRIAYTYAGRRVVLAEDDIEDYLERNRREPTGGRTGAAWLAHSDAPAGLGRWSIPGMQHSLVSRMSPRSTGASVRRSGRTLFEQRQKFARRVNR